MTGGGSMVKLIWRKKPWRHAVLTPVTGFFNDEKPYAMRRSFPFLPNFGDLGCPNFGKFKHHTQMDATGFVLGSDQTGINTAPRKHPQIDHDIARCKLNSSATGTETSVFNCPLSDVFFQSPHLMKALPGCAN